MFTGPELAALPPREDAGMLNQEMRQQPLATDIARFAGQAVAAVVTQEPYQGDERHRAGQRRLHRCAPKTLFTSCDQAMFVDQATYASPPSDAAGFKADLPLVTDQFRGTGFAAI